MKLNIQKKLAGKVAKVSPKRVILGVDSYEDRVLLDGGTYEGSSCLDKFLSQIGIYPADTVYVDGTEGVTVIDVPSSDDIVSRDISVTLVIMFLATNCSINLLPRPSMSKAVLETKCKIVSLRFPTFWFDTKFLSHNYLIPEGCPMVN